MSQEESFDFSKLQNMLFKDSKLKLSITYSLLNESNNKRSLVLDISLYFLIISIFGFVSLLIIKNKIAIIFL